MFETLKTINSSTAVVSQGGRIFIAKTILPADLELYKTIAGITADSPNLATIQYIQNIDGRLCAVRDYINGTPLEEYVERKGPLEEAEAVKIICDVCRGLEKLHAYGIVHRDITPSNIIIDPAGNAVIIDFGISRITKPSQSADTQILGTQGYAAPEQFGFSQTDVRADIYAVGVLLNYMLTLAMPNERQPQGIVGNVVKKCTMIDANDRYRSVNEVVFALEHPEKAFTFLGGIPGFRHGVRWHKVVACLYYAFVLMCLGIMVIGRDRHLHFDQALFLFLNMIVPVLIITDYNDWSTRRKRTAKLSKVKRTVLKIALAVLVSLPMDIYYTLIGYTE
ncbi:MAG: serine/threonine protein kinase [Clostridia bacterium]|nr:serine/threonine protein kinase [Clostridia bacterium]